VRLVLFVLSNYMSSRFQFCIVPYTIDGGRRGRDRMVVWFTATYPISSYLMLWVRISIGARWSGSSTNKTDRHDITGILLKVALSTIKQTNDICIINIFVSSLLPFVSVFVLSCFIDVFCIILFLPDLNIKWCSCRFYR
jgi:hypothetical protein